jgi:5-methylthioadenosine/S-adenosylhomocysteine deaminase
VEDSLKKFGKTPVQHLFDLGVLSELTNCAHCVHLTDQDIDLLKQSMASVTYNPDSNTKLASGVAPIVRLIEKGVPVAFGTDGVASNNDLSLFGTMDLGTKLQKVSNPDSLTMTATQALKMATIDGAKALGLEQEIGSIEVGKKADLVFVDLNFPHLRPLNNLISHLVYSTQGLEVDTVICDGKVLLKDKKFVAKQAGAIFKKADKYQNLIKKEVIQLRSRSH